MKLVEECKGVGAVSWQNQRLASVRYHIQRYQGMGSSGLPIPGLHRIEGNVELPSSAEPSRLVGAPMTLELEDGRALALTLADENGRVLAEGHGPGRGCSCC